MAWILLFFYVYPITFVGIPLSTRLIFALLGLGLFFYKRWFNINLLSPWIGLLPLGVMSLAAGGLNGTYDFTFAFYGISQLAIFFAAYFIAFVFLRKNKGDIVPFLFKVFIGVVLFQSFLALMMFFFKGFGEFMTSLISVNEVELSVMEENYGMRFLGWGANFFIAGVINGTALILIVYLFLDNRIKHLAGGTLIYIAILIIGILMSRTTIVGFLISLFYLLIWKWKNISMFKKKIKWILWILVFLCIGIFLLFIYLDEKIVLWAFELFLNYTDSGEMSSASTDRLKEMYVFPVNIETYLIGNGLFMSKTGGYYMQTDVGYLRLLYYGGIPAIVCYFFYPFWVIKKICSHKISSLLSKLLLILFLYMIVLNFKGLVDFNFLFVLIYCLIYYIKSKDKNAVSTTMFT